MKTLILFVVITFSLLAQRGPSGGRGSSGDHGPSGPVGRGRGPQIVKIVPTTQPAGTISIPATSDWQTSLESARMSKLDPTTNKPLYATTGDMLANDPQFKQLMQQIAREYGTPDLAAKAKALADAQAAYQAALQKVSGQ